MIALRPYTSKIEYTAALSPSCSYELIETFIDTNEIKSSKTIRWVGPKNETFSFYSIDPSEPDNPRKQYHIACNKLSYKAYCEWCKNKKWAPRSLKEIEKELYPDIFLNYEQRNSQKITELKND